MLNPQRPIWIRKASEVTPDQYEKFYKLISNDWENHLTVNHFKVEGTVQFSGIIYLPKRAPFDFEMGNKKSHGIKLYSRCIFITDNCKDLMPAYLGFVKGVIDCEDLPLNVSREFLQNSPIIKTLRKNLIKRSIALMNEMAVEEKKGDGNDEEEDQELKSTEKTEKKIKNNEKFKIFYKTFGKYIKWGLYEDPTNRKKLAKLLRYYSLHSPKQWISLDDYIKNMKEEQKYIYYVAGESLDSLQGSPFLEALTQKGYDVIMMTEPIDEYCVQQLREWDGKELKCATKEGLDMGQSEEEKKTEK